MEPLTDGEFGELDDLLLSDDLSEECMLAVTLGFSHGNRDWAGDSDARAVVAACLWR
jgi:hypothetical protein